MLERALARVGRLRAGVESELAGCGLFRDDPHRRHPAKNKMEYDHADEDGRRIAAQGGSGLGGRF